MTPSDACKALIRTSEGCVFKVYKDAGGLLTAGVGHRVYDLPFGATVSKQQAEDWFEHDVAKAASEVASMAPPCSQGQFDALTSFVFNLGPQRLAGSTLLHKHRAGDFEGAAAEFGKWIYCNHKVLPGLVKRRAAEARLYLS